MRPIFFFALKPEASETPSNDTVGADRSQMNGNCEQIVIVYM